jgi:hypothetical protein
MTNDTKTPSAGLEACGFIFEALVKSLALAGVQPDAGPGSEEYDNSELRVLAYLKRRARQRDAATKSQPPGVAAPARAEAPAQPISLARKPSEVSPKIPRHAIPVNVTLPPPISRTAREDQAAAPPAPGIARVESAEEGTEQSDLPVGNADPEMVDEPARQDTQPPSEPEHPAGDETTVDAEIASGVETGPHPEQPVEDTPPSEAPEPESQPRDDPGQDHPETAGPNSKEEVDGMVYGPSGIPKVGRTPPEQPERVSLPNARSNTPYEALIEGYSELRLRSTAPEGLTITPEGRVSAKAMPAGEYKMEVGALKNGRSVTLLVRLSVVPRPEDLWVSIPSDQDAPLAKPDEAFAAARGQAFMAAASKRGRSHAKEGSYRDDHFALKIYPKTGWHVMAVADGAGSAKLSREGSRVACETVIKALDGFLSQFMEPEVEDIVKRLRAASTDEEKRANQVIRPASKTFAHAAYMAAVALEKRAEELECRPADLSTTLAIAAARPVRDGWLFASFSVGDGGVAIWDEEAGEVSLMGHPDSGEFAGQTRFLSSDDFKTTEGKLDRVFVAFRERSTAFVAMTDGITDPKFETDAGLVDPEKWKRFWSEDFGKQVDVSPENPDLQRQFLGWLDFWSRGNHDDRTLAVMVPVQNDRDAERGGA